MSRKKLLRSEWKQSSFVLYVRVAWVWNLCDSKTVRGSDCSASFAACFSAAGRERNFSPQSQTRRRSGLTALRSSTPVSQQPLWRAGGQAGFFQSPPRVKSQCAGDIPSAAERQCRYCDVAANAKSPKPIKSCTRLGKTKTNPPHTKKTPSNQVVFISNHPVRPAARAANPTAAVIVVHAIFPHDPFKTNPRPSGRK